MAEDMTNINATTGGGAFTEGNLSNSGGVNILGGEIGTITYDEIEQRLRRVTNPYIGGEERHIQGAFIAGNVSNSGGVNVFGGSINRIFYTEEEKAYVVEGLSNPYLGLQSYSYDDRERYAGRSQQVAEALTLLTDPDNPLSLLFVTGASGSGKSSFAMAGLVPAIEAHYAARPDTESAPHSTICCLSPIQSADRTTQEGPPRL